MATGDDYNKGLYNSGRVIKETTSYYADQAAKSAAEALVSEQNAAASAVATDEDVLETAANVVLTNADVVSTNADVVLTSADALATAADVVITNADVVSTNADVISCAEDAALAEYWANEAANAGDVSLKLNKDGGIYTGLKETQDLTNTVTALITTVSLDYDDGQTQTLLITSGDAFAITFDNWPTLQSGSMSLVVKVNSGVTVGAITWPTALKNTAPDFTAITADADTTDLGYGRYELMFVDGDYFIDLVEEA